MPNRELFAPGIATADKLKLWGGTVTGVEVTSGGLITASLQARFAFVLSPYHSAFFNQ
jgi:hypothetical protein